MKFRKILRNQVEQTLPDWRDKFLSYKDLKKQLKLLITCPRDNNNNNNAPLLTRELNHFLHLLHLEIDKFNAFFVEREEEYIIRSKELHDRVVRAIDSDEDLMSLGREIVDFHGEMVLLESYSALNYSGLVKIIKKYDKRTGALLRVPFIQDVVKQPFFKVDVLKQLVKDSEVLLTLLFTSDDIDGPSSSGPPFSVPEEDSVEDGIGQNLMQQVPTDLSEIENMENVFIQLTLSALRTLEEIRGGTSNLSK